MKLHWDAFITHEDEIIKLRCYMFKKYNYWYAVCIDDFCVTRRSDLHDAKKNLTDALTGRCKTFVDINNTIKQMRNKAPLRHILQYWFMRLFGKYIDEGYGK